MKKLWITYAWADNEDRDIDFIARSLDDRGIRTTFDRRILIPGQRLWDQIGSIISDSSKVDAFSYVVTRNSVSNNACREELSYALDRVLSQRGSGFPIIGLMHGITSDALPVSLKVRLCVSLSAPNWVDMVVAGVERTTVPVALDELYPFVTSKFENSTGHWIRITPRFQNISPVCVAVDLEEKLQNNVIDVIHGPASIVPGENGLISSIKIGGIEGSGFVGGNIPAYLWNMNNEISPTQSCWVHCAKIPKRLWIGTLDQLLQIDL